VTPDVVSLVTCRVSAYLADVLFALGPFAMGPFAMGPFAIDPFNIGPFNMELETP
jgi:hypothetical protein